MDSKKLGWPGLDVSPICMGCMSIGKPGNDFNPWAIDFDDAKPRIRQACDLGINFRSQRGTSITQGDPQRN